MPIYEYRCHDCRRKVSIFVRSVASAPEPRCPRCGGVNLERLFSRVVVRRGGGRMPSDPGTDLAGDEFGDDLYGLDDPGFDDDTDPREFARWTRQMSEQIGEPLDPDLDRALTDIERGADPEAVLDALDDAGPPEPAAWDDEG